MLQKDQLARFVRNFRTKRTHNACVTSHKSSVASPLVLPTHNVFLPMDTLSLAGGVVREERRTKIFESLALGSSELRVHIDTGRLQMVELTIVACCSLDNSLLDNRNKKRSPSG